MKKKFSLLTIVLFFLVQICYGANSNIDITELARQEGLIVYLAQNTSTVVAPLKIKLPKNSSIDYKHSSCRSYLAPNEICKLYVLTPAINKINALSQQGVKESSGVFKWQSIGPDGGQIDNIINSPNSPQTLFAVNYGAGVFKSIDGGKTWAVSNNGLNSFYVSQLIYNNDSLYALVDEGTYVSRVYVSHNEGSTWEEVPSTGFLGDLGQLASYKNVLYAAGHGGVFRFDGTKWIRLGNFPVTETAATLLITDQAIYAASGLTKHSISLEGKIYKSVDGQTWTVVASGINPVTALINVGDTIYASTVRGKSPTILKTTNGGKNWERADGGDQMLGKYSINALVHQGSTLYAGTTDDNTLLTGYRPGGLYKSPDGGNSWEHIKPNKITSNVQAILITPTSFYVGTNQDLLQSTDDGNTWVTADKGITAHWITATLIAPNGTIVVGTQSGYVFVSHNQGASWAPALGVEQTDVSSVSINGLAADEKGALYATNLTGLYRSINDGQTWDVLKTPFKRAGSILSVQNKIYAGVGEAGNGRDVFLSTNQGEDWQPLNNHHEEFYHFVRTMAATNNLYLYISMNNYIWKTALQGGQPFTRIDSLDELSLGPLEQLININYDIAPGILYAVFSPTNFKSGGIYVSNDSGNTWSSLGENFKKIQNSCISINNSTLIVGSKDQGAFISVDNGKSWSRENLGLITKSIYSINSYKNITIIGTTSGVYKLISAPSV